VSEAAALEMPVAQSNMGVVGANAAGIPKHIGGAGQIAEGGRMTSPSMVTNAQRHAQAQGMIGGVSGVNGVEPMDAAGTVGDFGGTRGGSFGAGSTVGRFHRTHHGVASDDGSGLHTAGGQHAGGLGGAEMAAGSPLVQQQQQQQQLPPQMLPQQQQQQQQQISAAQGDSASLHNRPHPRHQCPIASFTITSERSAGEGHRCVCVCVCVCARALVCVCVAGEGHRSVSYGWVKSPLHFAILILILLNFSRASNETGCALCCCYICGVNFQQCRMWFTEGHCHAHDRDMWWKAHKQYQGIDLVSKAPVIDLLNGDAQVYGEAKRWCLEMLVAFQRYREGEVRADGFVEHHFKYVTDVASLAVRAIGQHLSGNKKPCATFAILHHLTIAIVLHTWRPAPVSENHHRWVQGTCGAYAAILNRLEKFWVVAFMYMTPSQVCARVCVSVCLSGFLSVCVSLPLTYLSPSFAGGAGALGAAFTHAREEGSKRAGARR
jgi:hypothetical protein